MHNTLQKEGEARIVQKIKVGDSPIYPELVPDVV